MTEWFDETILAPGRLPLFCFFVSVIVGFAVARVTTRMIRAGVRLWPGNVRIGDVRVHHAVLGIVLMLIGGVTGLAVPAELVEWRAVAAAIFGLGAAAVLDEFALILRMEDVYWATEGRASVNAVFAAIAITGLILIGVRPRAVDDFLEASSEGSAVEWVAALSVTAFNLALAVVTVFKGKLPTGLLGLFFPVFLWVGAIRLARPTSPWARWRYRRPGDRPARKLARATRRDQRLGQPVGRLGRWFADLVAGRPDPPQPRDPPRHANQESKEIQR